MRDHDGAVKEGDAAGGRVEQHPRRLSCLAALVGDGDHRQRAVADELETDCGSDLGAAPDRGQALEVARHGRRLRTTLFEPQRAARGERCGETVVTAVREWHEQVGAALQQRHDERLLGAVDVVDAVEDDPAGQRIVTDGLGGLVAHLRGVEDPAARELATVRGVQGLEVGGFGPAHAAVGVSRGGRRTTGGGRRVVGGHRAGGGRRVGDRGTGGDGDCRPARPRLDERLPEIVERGGERLGEVRSRRDGAVVHETPSGPLGDEAPQQALAGQAPEDDGRRAPCPRHQIAPQSLERHHGDVGDGPQPACQEVAGARTHRCRPDDDREGLERAAALELEDALCERVLELGEAADEDGRPCAACCRLGTHGRRQPTTGRGRDRLLSQEAGAPSPLGATC